MQASSPAGPVSRKPAISIVTPCLNRAWAVRACIASVRSQVGVDYEHLIVDAGSTDGTLEVLQTEAAADHRIRFVSQPDDGMYDAINRGMRMASADVVAYLNTDDFYLVSTLARVVDTFARRPEVSMLYGHWMSWYPATGFLELLPVHSYTATDIATYACLPQPSVFFRRSVFEALGGFDLSYKLVADNEFFSRAVALGFVCVHVDAFFSVQTVHGSNLLAGSDAAAGQAWAEIDRYRSARLVGPAHGRPAWSRSVSQARSTLRRKLVPLRWRVSLIYQIARGVAVGRVTSLAPWRKIEGDWSVASLCRYLLSRRAQRPQQGYLKVAPEQFAAFLGFAPPVPPVEVRSSDAASEQT